MGSLEAVGKSAANLRIAWDGSSLGNMGLLAGIGSIGMDRRSQTYSRTSWLASLSSSAITRDFSS
ncbi:hypothetical protein N431DRAFT_232502 [Stipitochalara longipes BDJ]|nr:hypothetical protein N431DRAFT_232502 [Stipitochalara longipes BDJ]